MPKSASTFTASVCRLDRTQKANFVECPCISGFTFYLDGAQLSATSTNAGEIQMKHGFFGFTMGAVFLGAISMANAGQPVTLTSGQMDNVTAGSSATSNAINSATSEALAATGNSYGSSKNVAVAADVTVQHALGAAVACGCSFNHIH